MFGSAYKLVLFVRINIAGGTAIITLYIAIGAHETATWSCATSSNTHVADCAEHAQSADGE